MKPILIIDGDVPAYKACPGERWKSKAKVVDNKLVRELNFDGTHKEIEYTQEEDSEYLREAWANFKGIINGLCERFWTKEYMMAVGTRYHYRSDMYPQYKANRNPNNKAAKFIPIIRQKAVYEGMAVF